MPDIKLVRGSPTFVNPEVLEAARWALTLLRFNLAKYGLPANRVVSSECHGLLIDDDGPFSRLRATVPLDLTAPVASILGATTLAELMTATITIDVRGRMVFGATLDVSFTHTGITPVRRQIGELLVAAMRDQEASLLALMT